jgi:hypothetical protein
MIYLFALIIAICTHGKAFPVSFLVITLMLPFMLLKTVVNGGRSWETRHVWYTVCYRISRRIKNSVINRAFAKL